jgi:probable HAF family extracellular repeat protein
MNSYKKFLFLLMCVTPGLLQAALLQLNNGNFPSALAVSYDGNVIAGYITEGNQLSAFHWSKATGLANIGILLGGNGSRAMSMSADGNFVVGYSMGGANQFRAFLWNQTTNTMINLGTLHGGAGAIANGVNADGTVVVGGAEDGLVPGNLMRAFRWTKDTRVMESLGALPDGSESAANGVNADGSVVVGYSTDARDQMRAFRWTEARQTMESLGTLPGGDESVAYGVSGNGDAVVGYSTEAHNQKRAFRWTETRQIMENLGTLNGGNESIAYGTNADGSVVVGSANDDTNQEHGFRWTEATGLQTIEEWLSANGNRTAGHITRIANAVNADGSVVVGRTISNEAFIARVGSDGAGLITISDLLQSLANNNAVFPAALEAGNLALHGLNGYPLAKIAPEPYDDSSWVAGDWRTVSRGGRGGLGEVGFAHRLRPGQHLTLSLGGIRSSQRLIAGGKAITQGPYVFTQLITKLTPNRPLWATLGIFYHWGEAEIKRSYINAGVPDISNGKTKVHIPGLRVRLDAEAGRLGRLELAPYIELTTLSMRANGYSESNGGFPARFNKRRENSTQSRIGLHGKLPLEQNWYLTSQAEGVRAFQKKGSNTTGQLIGLFPFDIPGQKLRNTSWLKGSLGINHQVKQGLFSVTAHGATKGQDPKFWLAVAYRIAF